MAEIWFAGETDPRLRKILRPPRRLSSRLAAHLRHRAHRRGGFVYVHDAQGQGARAAERVLRLVERYIRAPRSTRRGFGVPHERSRGCCGGAGAKPGRAIDADSLCGFLAGRLAPSDPHAMRLRRAAPPQPRRKILTRAARRAGGGEDERAAATPSLARAGRGGGCAGESPGLLPHPYGRRPADPRGRVLDRSSTTRSAWTGSPGWSCIRLESGTADSTGREPQPTRSRGGRGDLVVTGISAFRRSNTSRRACASSRRRVRREATSISLLWSSLGATLVGPPARRDGDACCSRDRRRDHGQWSPRRAHPRAGCDHGQGLLPGSRSRTSVHRRRPTTGRRDSLRF